MTEYCRKKGTNEIFVKTDYLMARGDMEVCPGPDSPVATIIASVIPEIRIEDYAKASFGRPAMPKVAQVSELVGFKVKPEEIIEAMELVK